MKGIILKKTGRALLAAFVLFIISTPLFSAEQVVTVLENSRIEAGESTTLSLKISGIGSDVKPLKVPHVKGLEIRSSGMQRSFQFINGRSWRGIVLSFRITALEKGAYTIPSFVFDVNGSKVKSDPVKLTVLKGNARSVQGMASSGKISSVVEISKEKVYSGEPLLMRHYILFSGIPDLKIRGVEKMPEAKGFVLKRIEENIADAIVNIDGTEMVKSHVFTTVLVPAESGLKEIGGGSVVISYEVGDSFFDFSRQSRVAFEKTEVNVIAIPSEGKPLDYRGDVGVFTMKAGFDNSPVMAFQEKKISVTVSGKGNLLTLSKPQFLQQSRDVKVLVERGDERLSIKDNEISGERDFTVTVIPEKKGELDLGSLVLQCYNPLKGTFEQVASEGLVIKVLDNPAKPSEGALSFDKDEKAPPLVDPLVIVIVSLFIMGGILFLVLWERKRYSIVAEDGEIEKSDNVASENKSAEIYGEVNRALEEGSAEKYLTASYRLLDILIREHAHDRPAWFSRAQDIKEIISSNKFGGCKLSLREMENLYHEMGGFIKTK